MEDDNAVMKGRETPRGRINRLVTALNAAMTLDRGARLVSIGTRLEVREANGHYHDQGLDSVAEFHRAFDCVVETEPGVPKTTEISRRNLEWFAHEAGKLGNDLKSLAAGAKIDGDEAGALLLIRLQLCQEELAELAMGMLNRDPVECLDALTDMTYVADGTYLTLGLGHYKAAALAEVHASNMSKLGEDGRPIISDAGRVVKGPNYKRPDLRGVLGLGEVKPVNVREPGEFGEGATVMRED